MTLRLCALVAATLLLVCDASAQTTKMNIPGCGPEQGEIYKAGVALREDANKAAKTLLSALHKEDSAIVSAQAKLGCLTSTPDPSCSGLAASRAALREAISEANKFSVAIGTATMAYRTQQPFVTATGETCLRCKSPGDFACEKPGVVPGHTPASLPSHSHLAGRWVDLHGNVIHVSQSGNSINCIQGNPAVVSTGTVNGRNVTIRVVQAQRGSAPLGTTYNGTVVVEPNGNASAINWAGAGTWRLSP